MPKLKKFPTICTLFQAKPGDPVMITEGSIQASITDTLESKTILYQLQTQSDFILLDNTKCEISLSSTFNLSHLGQDGIYDLSIKAYDQDDLDRCTMTILEIPFQVNKLPPVFSSENTAYISNPEFQQKLEIGTVQAQDGDIDINAEIDYEILDITNCTKCFEINEKTGVLTWIKTIPKNTILQKKIEFEIKATENGIPEEYVKSSTAKFVVAFPGDELNPEFAKQGYTAELTRVSF